MILKKRFFISFLKDMIYYISHLEDNNEELKIDILNMNSTALNVNHSPQIKQV